ncbi:NAD(P)H-hydrate dehydratase [Desulfocurvibacter africanus]|uniref:Sugar kinase n=1 Tax=Desulfocurvibacter africanus subsp. africanus str. Walvis Bay TaxID=690850 RepID=F3Z192_DESAF|nr:NAD(P)H-hydrate dehydratase [Desulfocurvibacter africanus]EGJ51095.1 sugar kinase [Desulfocurvibacter africanus subsp. africanus str. Walvis Bay]
MPWLIVGTIPREEFPLVHGPCVYDGGSLQVNEHDIPVARGTPALLATACIASKILGIAAPLALLAGDTGRGQGSRQVYAKLMESIPELDLQGVTFHYLQPDVEWHNKILWKLEERNPRPLLVADAGFMYVAKMSGFAASYDLFTPDAGEMAFLADEKAPHPFYTRGFLLQEEERVPELIERAYAAENAAKHLLVKGCIDYVVAAGQLVKAISEPSIPAMEPIGGTGDTVTGLVTALLSADYSIPQACTIAAKTNRQLGLLAAPNPAFSVANLMPFLPQALAVSLG